MLENTKYIKFLALISKDDKPLYLKSFDIGEDNTDNKNANEFLKYNFLSHMALDVLASPTSLYSYDKDPNSAQDKNHSLLFIEDGISVFGNETSSGIKVVIGLGSHNQISIIDQEKIEEVNKSDAKAGKNPGDTLNSVFSSVYKCYIRAICNPFTNICEGEREIEKAIQNSRFDESIKKVVDSWNSHT